MDALKNIGLTDKDFQLLINGLEYLPHKDAAGDLMIDMLAAAMLPKDSPERLKHESDQKEAKKKKAAEKELMMEDIKILQGKLLILKRQFLEAGILKQVDEVLKAKE